MATGGEVVMAFSTGMDGKVSASERQILHRIDGGINCSESELRYQLDR
jgi:hypothetical protein